MFIDTFISSFVNRNRNKQYPDGVYVKRTKLFLSVSFVFYNNIKCLTVKA